MTKIVSTFSEADLRKGVDILAGTPGRILDFINSGKIDVGLVEQVVLDEVDRMLDMGFQESVEDILKYIYTEKRERLQQQPLFLKFTHLIHTTQYQNGRPESDFLHID